MYTGGFGAKDKLWIAYIKQAVIYGDERVLKTFFY